MATASISRRGLLQQGGALLVAFAASSALPKRASAQTAPAGKPLDPTQVDSFFALHPDGTVTIYTSKVDVGTGLATAMRQVAAEELGIPVTSFTVIQGDTSLTPDHGGTGGSTGVPRGCADIRNAAATLRQGLLALASTQLNVPAADLTIAGSSVRSSNGGASVAIASLVGGKRVNLKVDPKAPLQKPAGYTVVGKPVLRTDVPGKCTGRHPYLHDFTLPGLLHGRVVRPPAFGAKLLAVDEASLRAIPGVRVIRIESFLGVVSKDEWAAERAARALKATWSEGPALPDSDSLPEWLRTAPIDRDQQVVNRGDAAGALSTSARQLSASYYWPYQSHASMGPSCAVADIRQDGGTVWTSSQNPYGVRATLARMFTIAPDKLRVIYLDGSGSYGTNGADDAAADALLLSHAASAPVRVQWSRQDELGLDPKGPAQMLDLRGGLDAEGRIAAWETQMWIPTGPPGARPLLGPGAAGIPQGAGQPAGMMTQNGDPPYAAANVRVTAHLLKDTLLRLSNLRAPGKIANAFAVESFTDELAAAAKVDPVEFRLRGLSDARAIEVIRRAARLLEWQTRPSPATAGAGLRVGRGLAYVRYKQAENYAAIAMEVEVDRASGKVLVRRIACAHDGGLVINPDGLRNQVEGNILQTLSRTLHEEVQFGPAGVKSVDWVSYPLLRFPEAPLVNVELIDHPELPALGAGEAASAPVAAALANAIFDATGVRLRRVPFTAARLKSEFARA